MFTGIVKAASPVTHAEVVSGVMRLVVETPPGFTAALERGASVAVNGVCLTVVEWTDNMIAFDVIDESLRRSNLGAITPGSIINLERAARFGDEIGGHCLSGHVHTQAQVVEVQTNAGNVAMALKVDPKWTPYVISKGYIAINGCSLTIGDVDDTVFWLHLIPETREVTNLDACAPGTMLNVEIDHQTQVIVETVERYLRNKDESSTR